MVLTVLENAYLKKAEEHPNYSQLHEQILLLLLHENKHYTKEELLCFANYNEKKLDKIIKELEATGTITTKGWLVKTTEKEELMEKIRVK
ncbi:Uncharacterised protein [uncultured archaeon]|nr:Uncharacterised protein [uncultured archaeon]